MSKIDAQTLRRVDHHGQLAVHCMHTELYYSCFFKMESRNSRNCKRLKRYEDDGVRAGGEGNVTAYLVVPLLEEQIPGTETCSYEGVGFTMALFLTDDIIYGPLSHARYLFANSLNIHPILSISFCSGE